MAKGGNQDNRQTYVVDSLRLNNRGSVPPAPNKGAIDLYCRQGKLYWLDESGVEHAFGGVGVSAFPGWTWGRDGVSGVGDYLLNEGVSSDSTGRLVTHLNPILLKVIVNNGAASTFEVTVQEHDGVLYTDLAVLALTTERSKVFDLTIPLTRGKQLAVKVSSGTALSPVVSMIVDGIYK